MAVPVVVMRALCFARCGIGEMWWTTFGGVSVAWISLCCKICNVQNAHDAAMFAGPVRVSMRVTLVGNADLEPDPDPNPDPA